VAIGVSMEIVAEYDVILNMGGYIFLWPKIKK
jgi:hypothetical protein